MVPGLLPIFLHGCEIKSGSGLGTRLTGCMVHVFTNDAFQKPFSLTAPQLQVQKPRTSKLWKTTTKPLFLGKYMYIHMNEAFHVFRRSLLLLYKNHPLYKQAFQFVVKLAVQTYTLKCSTVMSLIIRTIQLFEHPPPPSFSRKIDYCIPSI